MLSIILMIILEPRMFILVPFFQVRRFISVARQMIGNIQFQLLVRFQDVPAAGREKAAALFLGILVALVRQ